MSLKKKMVLTILALLALIVAITNGYTTYQNYSYHQSNMREKRVDMRDELIGMGETVSRIVALGSARAVVVSDFLFLKEVIDSTVSSDEEIVYGIIMGNDRQAFAHSERDKNLTVLDDEASRFAANQDSFAFQEITEGERQLIEVIEPIVVSDERWGTVRFGISLDLLNEAIADEEAQMAARLQRDVAITVGVAVLLMLFASLLASAAGNRLVRPIVDLVHGAEAIAKGKLEANVQAAGGGPEIDNLVDSFNVMVKAIRERDEALHTSMRKIEDALEAANESNRLKDEFLASVSHELRTPLNALVNVPSVLLREFVPQYVWECPKCGQKYHPDDEYIGTQAQELVEQCPECSVEMSLVESERDFDFDSYCKSLQLLYDAGNHMFSVVSNLLDFSRLKAGRAKLRVEHVRMQEVVSKLLAAVLGHVKSSGCHLAFQVEKAPILLGDSVKITQIFINLVTNAIKFTPEGKSIDVVIVSDEEYESKSSHYKKNYVCFAVRDEGIGIPEDQLETIFDKFRQVDGGHTRRRGGTGLGLAITKELVELHGGEIWVESRLDEGSAFYFTIPKDTQDNADQESTERHITPRAVEGFNRRRVAVVDEDDNQRRIISMLLEKNGFETFSVDRFDKALEVIAEQVPHVVLLNVLNDKKDPLSILEGIKADRYLSHLPVIVCSNRREHLERSEKLGGIAFECPVAVHRLMEIIITSTGG